MAWRLVVQPNGKLAHFSEIIDDFTCYDMDEKEAFEMCRDIGGVDCANQKIARAKADLIRFEESLRIIELVHGKKTRDERKLQMTTNGEQSNVERGR